MSRMARLISPRRHVRLQLVAPFAILSIATAAVGTYIATSLVGGGVGNRFDAQLVEASRGTSDTIARRETTHLEWLRSIAFTAGLPQALRTGADAVEELVLPVTVNVGAELVAVVRPDGGVAFGVELTDPSTLAYRPTSLPAASWEPVIAVLEGRTDARGDKFAGVVGAVVEAVPLVPPKAAALPRGIKTEESSSQLRDGRRTADDLAHVARAA